MEEILLGRFIFCLSSDTHMLSFSLSLLDMTCGCVTVLTDKVVCSRLQTQKTPSLVLTDLTKVSRGPEGESQMDT